jgi:hypothetical protein
MRKDDPEQMSRSFRSPERYVQVNGQWFFAAREGEIGPFRTRAQAEREAVAYIRARQQTTSGGGRLVRKDPSRGLPGYVYRCILSMEKPVQRPADLVLDREDLD